MRNGLENLVGSHDIHMLCQGPRTWNAWREANPGVVADLNDLHLPVSQRQFGQVQGGPINLGRAELCRAALEHATLIDANLAGALLIEADLSDARMEGADLRGADLSNANFDNADLKGARLEDAILRGARLRDARNLMQAQIDRAQGDESTTLPPKLAIPKHWLSDAKSRVSELEKRTSRHAADLRGDLYAALGVKRGASPREIRAAYLKLVKDLHPDGRFDDPAADERLKAVNRAYHELKELEKRAAARRAESGFLGRRSVLFSFGLLASTIPMLVVVGALYGAGYFVSDTTRPTGKEGESVRVTLATTPAPDQQIVPIEKSVSADDAAWADAKREGTSIALHRYLERYPQGRHAQKATEEVAIVVASEAALDGRSDGRDGSAAGAVRPTLSRYLEKYPDGHLAPAARQRLAAIDAADTAAWSKAQQTPTKGGLRGYLDAYPGGNHADKARQALAAIEFKEAVLRADQSAWAEAERTGTKEAMSWYLESYPNGVNVAKAHRALAAIDKIEAIRRADQSAWAAAERAGTKEALTGYLNAHPDGTHVASARRALAAIDKIEAIRRADQSAWAAAERTGTKEALTGYLNAHPDGTRWSRVRSQALAAHR